MMVRRLLPDDAAAFQAVRLSGLLECPSAFSSSHAEEVGTPLETIARSLAPRPNGAVFGCFIGNELAGVAGVEREAQIKLSHKAVIWGMYVLPAHRRHGIARKLILAALEYASVDLGMLSVNLGVNTSNHAALSLYEAVGFEKYGTERGFLRIDGVLHDEHLMAWRRVLSLEEGPCAGSC
jgi:ribosomal protein S18 acetylase RimI-like enzyme